MRVVQIIWPVPVFYNLTNGILPPRQYMPGEIYELPEYAVHGMLARGWARLVDPGEIDSIIEERKKAEEPQDIPAFIEKR